MSGLPYYKRYPRDFLDGVQGMGPELIGIYTVVIDLLYARDGELPRDDRHMAGILGCSIRKARALTDSLLETGKVSMDGNFIVNSRAKSELKLSRNQREASAKGGRNSKPNKQNQRVNRNHIDKSRLERKVPKEEKRIREILEAVLGAERTSDVIEHRKKKKCQLTVRAAELLADKFLKSGNPAAAADMMIERGWQGFELEWFKNARKVNGENQCAFNAAYNQYVMKTTDEKILSFEQWSRQHGQA